MERLRVTGSLGQHSLDPSKKALSVLCNHSQNINITNEVFFMKFSSMGQKNFFFNAKVLTDPAML